MEVWKELNIFNNYSISSLGNIRNNSNGFVYKKCIHKSTGYVIWTGPDRKQYKVHRLVAEAFPEICGKYKDGLVVDHINTIKDDNRAENLRWVTSKENSNNPLTRKKISEYMKNNNPMKRKDVSMKVSIFRTGKHLTEEHKNKISESEKGKVITEETRKKIGEYANKRIRNTKGRFI